MRIKHVILLAALAMLAAHCGKNIWQSSASQSSDAVKIAKARVLLDDGEYAEAEDLLLDMDGDSNERRMLLVAATLGKSGFVLWDLLVDVIDSASQNGSKSGIDNFFDFLDDGVFGVGDERTERLASISSGITILGEAPDAAAREVENLRCFLAGVLAVPSVEDGKTAVSNLNAALEKVVATATGSGGTAAECPDVSALNEGMLTIQRVQRDFSAVLASAANCSFLNLDEAGDDLNEVERKLASLTAAADKGCVPTPSCSGPACDALGLGCVKEVVGEEAVAGDGLISTCEYVQNCLTPGSCFGS